MVSLRSDGVVGPGVGWSTHVAGAESNVAIALARLWHSVAWFGRVGDDAFGRLVVREIRAEGVEVQVEIDDERPTGFMFLRQTAIGAEVDYHRAGSAASGEHVGVGVAQRSGEESQRRIAVMSGITAALGREPAALVKLAHREQPSAAVLDVSCTQPACVSRAQPPSISGASCRRSTSSLGHPTKARLLAPSIPRERSCEGSDPAEGRAGETGGTSGSRAVCTMTQGGRGPAARVAVVEPGAGDGFWLAAYYDLPRGWTRNDFVASNDHAGAAAMASLPRSDYEGLPAQAPGLGRCRAPGVCRPSGRLPDPRPFWRLHGCAPPASENLTAERCASDATLGP